MGKENQCRYGFANVNDVSWIVKAKCFLTKNYLTKKVVNSFISESCCNFSRKIMKLYLVLKIKYIFYRHLKDNSYKDIK